MSSYSEAVNTRLENAIQHGNDTVTSLQSIIGETNPITVTAALLGAINSYALRKLNLQIIGLLQA